MTLQSSQAELVELLTAESTQSDLLAPLKNLSIYQNNIRSTFISALLDVYPLIVKLVGEDFFRVMAQEYSKRYPSCSGNLHDYGEYFADFVIDYPPVKNLVYLSEVAQFEWTCHVLFRAANPPSFDKQILAAFDQQAYGKLHFVLNPACCLMKCHYPLLRIIDLCKGEIENEIDLHEGGVHLLLIRNELTIRLIPLTNAEFVFLSALHNDQSLSAALDEAYQVDNQFQLDDKLPSWIQDKILVDCFLGQHHDN